MGYNPQIHHRKSMRLKGYDYSSAGLYFITVCVQSRLNLLGRIKNGETILNDAGRMVEKWYLKLENKFPEIKCREYIVMPNHFHCIIEITDVRVRVSQRRQPDNNVRFSNDETKYDSENKKYGASIFDIMDWFKTMTTNEYIRGVKNKNWPRFEKRFWQLKYWDHIIRSEDDFFRISNYIKNNPKKWEEDKLNN